MDGRIFADALGLVSLLLFERGVVRFLLEMTIGLPAFLLRCKAGGARTGLAIGVFLMYITAMLVKI